MLGVAANRPARIVLLGGCLVAAVLGAEFLIGTVPEGAPYIITVFGAFVFAFVAATRRSVPVAAGAITAGGLVGLSAAVIPAVVITFRPPVPSTGGWALAVVVTALLTAGVLTGWRAGLGFDNAVMSGLLAAVVAALLIGPVVTAMAQFGPESWVPRTVSHALTPATRLAERRHLAGEPYLIVLLLGALLALILGVVALRSRRQAGTTPPRTATGDPRRIELGEV